MTGEPSDLARSLVLNGLQDVVRNTDDVVDTEESLHRLEAAFDRGTAKSERGDFVTALHELEVAGPDGSVGDETHRTLQQGVDAVLSELAAEDARLRVVHETGASLSAREVALYNFVHERTPEPLERLTQSSAVRAEVLDGARYVENKAYNDAVEAFERAVDASEAVDECLATRVLAAWASHWAGDDDRALDYVDEAAYVERDSWALEMVETVVTDASIDAYRAGTLAMSAYVRARANVPDESSLRVRVGRGEVGSVEWDDWSDHLECVMVGQLDSSLRMQLELEGPVGALPDLQAYYATLGTVEPASAVPRTVEHILFDGPVTGEADETLYVDATRKVETNT